MSLSAAFTAEFGHAPSLIARAPGRVNLIGEHTDYNDGFVLPAAITVETQVAVRARDDGAVRVLATDFAATSQFDLTPPILPDPRAPWANYVRGMFSALMTYAEAEGIDLPGADIAIAGTIPRGSGLSSSASLSVALGTAINELAALGLDPTHIARLAQASECDFVGTQCGIMDQLISARGVAGHALLIDCRSLDCRPVPIPQGTAIVIVHSGVVRGLVEGHYNERRRQCETAARALGVAALRDADMAMLGAADFAPLITARARHVITENARTLAATEALAAGDLAMLGELMRASHASMRDDFAITVPPVDALVEELNALIAKHAGNRGGARMTGGGFGGAVVALMPEDAVAAVTSALTYRTPEGAPPVVMIEQAVAGASLLV